METPKTLEKVDSPLHVDKENILSLMESQTEPHVHIYSWIGKVLIEAQTKKTTWPP